MNYGDGVLTAYYLLTRRPSRNHNIPHMLGLLDLCISGAEFLKGRHKILKQVMSCCMASDSTRPAHVWKNVGIGVSIGAVLSVNLTWMDV
jgi:hypothetical protein